MKERLNMTPLQRVVGFDVAEEVYDELPFNAQLVLDLLIEGYTQQDIADTLCIGQATVNDIIRRSRTSLAMQKAKLILETRIFYRETHTSVIDNPNDDFDNRNRRHPNYARPTGTR